MNPTQPSTPSSEPPQQPPLQSASAYYNQKRKRSFLFSRLTVIGSMFVLIIALGVNIAALSSQGQNTVKSNAAGAENPQKVLPILPKGCSYQQSAQAQGGVTVICPTPTPIGASAFPINIVLPQLPPQCGFETSASGSAIQCFAAHAPIPTVPVTLPKACVATPRLNTVSCTNSANQPVNVPLPSLPLGCTYQLNGDQYNVACEAK